MTNQEYSQFSLNSKFAMKRDSDDGSFLIEGFAIHGGEDFVVNDIFVVPENEMRNCAKTLKGAKLMKDHNYEVDSIVGKVEKTKVTHDESCGMKGVHYNAKILPEEEHLAKKISEGLVDATSIGFEFDPICTICGKPYFSDKCEHVVGFDKDCKLKTKNMHVHELSLVAFGADPNATVQSGFEFDGKIKENFKKLKEDFIMTNKNDTKVAELQEENLKLSQEVKDLEAKIEQKEAEFKQTLEDAQLESQEKILTLSQEKEALQAEFEKVGEELAAFRAEKEALIAAELESKKEELLQLAKELKVEETIGDIEEMSAEFIDKQIAVFKKVIENTPKIGEFKTEQNQPHATEGKRESFQIGKFFHGYKGDQK